MANAVRDKNAVSAVKIMTKYCLEHDDCRKCALLDFCNSLGFSWTTPDKWDLSILERNKRKAIKQTDRTKNPEFKEGEDGGRMTNADKIRGMTDEELATLFTKVMAGNSGVQLDNIWQEKEMEENQRYFTRLNWLDWLKQEVSDNG